MSSGCGPVVPRRRLGAELRMLRDQAGLTIGDVAKELECSVSKISRLETGKAVPKSWDIRVLLDFYGVTDQTQRDRLMCWVRDGQRQAWWSDYSKALVRSADNPLLPSNFSDEYVGLEQDAGKLRSFESGLVPSLLQTEDYSRAVLNTLSTTNRGATNRLVEFGMRRQDRLYAKQNPLMVHLLLDEAVLHRTVGGEQVMRGQLKRLLDDSQLQNIVFQALPFNVGAHCSVAGSFVVLAFPDSDNDVVYVQRHLNALYFEKRRVVESYKRLFDTLVDLCMDPEQSVALIEEILEDN